MTTFDDDYVQLDSMGHRADVPRIQRIGCVQLGLHWPPPDRLFHDGVVWERQSHSEITDDERAGMTNVCRGALYHPLIADPDRPCEHENYHAHVTVARVTQVEGGPVKAFQAEVQVRCAACGERFRWIGVPYGDMPDRPTTGLDEFTLRAPCRPASADADFGLDMPGLLLNIRTEDPPRVNEMDMLTDQERREAEGRSIPGYTVEDVTTCPHRDDEPCSVCVENASLRSRIAALEEQLASTRQPVVSVTYLQAIDLLNEALAADPGAVEELVATRVPCNAKLADHPTIQVGAVVLKGKPVPGTEHVGLLGILNGVFGCQPGTSWGWIAADVSPEDRRTIRRFKVAVPEADGGD